MPGPEVQNPGEGRSPDPSSPRLTAHLLRPTGNPTVPPAVCSELDHHPLQCLLRARGLPYTRGRAQCGTVGALLHPHFLDEETAAPKCSGIAAQDCGVGRERGPDFTLGILVPMPEPP